MMSFIQKTLALASAFSMFASATTASALVSDNSSSKRSGYMSTYQPPKELKKLASTEFKVMNAFDVATKKELSKIRDPKLRKQYSDIAKAKRDGMRSVFSDLRSGMKFSFSTPDVQNARDSIKLSAKGTSELLREIREAAKSKNSPLSISAEETAKVESGIVGFQKDLVVAPVRSFLDTYLKDGMKETGDWKASVEVPYGKANFSLERYSSILSMVGFAQEADFVFKADYDLAIPTATTYDNETFEAIPGGKALVKGSAMFDANVKVIKNKAYVFLRDYSLDASVSGSGTSSADEMKAGLAKAKASLDLFKGKTVSIDLPEDAADAKPEAVLKKVRDALLVLESTSVFTPVRRMGEGRYALALNGKTVAALAGVFGEKVTKGELNQSNKEILASGLSYSESNGKTVISATDPRGEGAFSVSKEAAGYSLHLETIGRKDRSVFDVTPEGAKLRAKSDGAEVSGSWLRADGSLSFIVSENGSSAFEASGTLLLNRIDLAFKLLGKDLGTFKMTRTGQKSSTELSLSFDIPPTMSAEMEKVLIKSSQNATFETGTFNVEVPTDAVDIEEILK